MEIRQIKASKKKRKAAAYCRVSTEKDAQAESFETQTLYYTRLIESQSHWQMVGIYADEGISGTSAKKRVHFNRMMDDARDGRIDLILVKSVSRFARNITECSQYVRELKRLCVEVYFEREKISSFDAASEFLFHISAIVAQEESRSISQNVRWRYEKDFSRGRHFMGNHEVMGYDVSHGVLVPNHDRWIVEQIFQNYIDGMNFSQIARTLNQSGAARMRSKRGFEHKGIGFILRNPIYVGDLQLQKQAPRDYLTKRPQKHTDYVTYYVENDHEGIISREVWQAAQARLNAGTNAHRPKSSSHFLSGMLFCGQCGAPYSRRTFQGSDGMNYHAWLCTERQRGSRNAECQNPYIREVRLLEELASALALPAFHPDEFRRRIRRVTVTNGSLSIDWQPGRQPDSSTDSEREDPV